ncbi:MAG TPA: ATPase, T2SS/T4P/T4SS family, partial [Thermoanaerobaculia bacterium]|nr:ATPase, T2SS/T4P/T4SS family [Thermoanaerobaculia bacterium]
MSIGQDDLLFGRIALHYKLITREQLTDATGQQAREGGYRKLGEILVEKGVLSPPQLTQLLAVQKEYIAKQQGQAAPAAPAPAPPAPPPVQAAPAPAGPLTGSPMPASLVQETPPPASLVAAVAAPPLASPAAPAAAAAPPPAPPSAVAAPPPSVSLGQGAKELDRLLETCVRRGASDIHVHSGAPLKIRIHGRLQELDGGDLLAPATAERLIQEVLSGEQREALRTKGQVDFAYTLPGIGRFRANAYRQQIGMDAVFRAIPPQPPSLTSLGLPSALARFANFHQGMVLFTGPAGCGKSSTLAAMVDIINQDRRDHIITVEDPIEYIHPSKQCVVNQRQVGPHTGSFARALRAALREDPDIIAIGELRDLETISLALTAAET